MKIRNTFFMVFLTSSLLLLSITLLLVNWNFKRGMDDYIEQRTYEDFKQSLAILSTQYTEHGSWQTLAGQHKKLMDILVSNTQNSRRYGLITPPPIGKRKFRAPFEREQRPLRPKHAMKLRGVPDNGFGLKDADGNSLIFVNTRFETQDLTIVDTAQNTIGYLVIPASNDILSDYDKVFTKDQLSALPFIGAIALCISVFIALFISRLFVKPIGYLSATATRLSRGDYSPLATTNRKDELGELTRQLSELANVLNSNEQARKHWLADISHELRTPVAILRGEIEALQDGVRPLNQEALQSLNSDILHLQKLIEDLYHLSETELGGLRYQKQTVDIKAVLHDVLLKHLSAFDEKALSLSTRFDIDSGLIEADEHRINQVLDNIFTNTQKYTQAGGSVHIDLSADDQYFIVCIDDSAPGVPPEALGRLFDHLYRVPSTHNIRGSGLGLAICKRIIKAHNGTISAESSHLGGLKITIQLPKSHLHE